MGPYIKQHDPHFLPNGRISVYDNRADFADGKILGGSRILSIDPVTRKVNTVYQGDARNSFFSNMQGEHQYLPNGNILITEPDAGRIFEVTPSGEVVWSYINRYDEDEVYRVLGGTRYAEYYRNFTEGAAQCQ
jgi:transposase InsO family protein